MAHELVVHCFVKDGYRLCLIQFGQILKRQGDVLFFVLFGLISVFGAWAPRLKKAHQALLQLNILRRVYQRGHPEAIHEKDPAHVDLADEAFCC